MQIRALTPERFVLDVAKPFVFVRAGTSKNKKEKPQPLTCEQADLLRSYLKDRDPKGPAFDMPEKDWARMLRKDLEHAGIPIVDKATGQSITFHSLRQSTATFANLAGVDLKTNQRVLRHSKASLTMDTYADGFTENEHPAVELIEDVIRAARDAASAVPQGAPR